MKKLFSTLLLSTTLAVGAAKAAVYVRIGPPPPRPEVITVRPGPRYVWLPGYHRWSGNRYYWQPGAWVLPPGRYHHGFRATGGTRRPDTTGLMDTGDEQKVFVEQGATRSCSARTS